MNQNQLIKKSKFLSLILRHNPQRVGIALDDQGYACVKELLEKINLTFDELTYVVENNNKKRFAFNNDLTKIRASQGHSLKVDLKFKPVEPPELLYHGTSTKNIGLIKENGLIKMNRQHVHLSKDEATAVNVGSRHGKPVVLKVLSGKMQSEKYEFYYSENKVWLTDNVPVKYIVFPENE